MSHIRSQWTSQEVKIHNYLKGNKIKHKMHPKLDGNPDILLINTKTLVFLHGCFWHKCPKCFIEPETRKKFWKEKLNGNVKRDREVNRLLEKEGWKVLRFWEHQIRKSAEKAAKKIMQELKHY